MFLTFNTQLLLSIMSFNDFQHSLDELQYSLDDFKYWLDGLVAQVVEVQCSVD